MIILIDVLEDPAGRPWLALDSCLEHGVLPPTTSLLFTIVSVLPAYAPDSSCVNSAAPNLELAWATFRHISRHSRWSAGPYGT